jgi:pimeloyl-ACP methyl ester carboxylesterase
MSDITPFTIKIPQAYLDDLQRRLENTRFMPPLADSQDYGIEVEYVKELVDYWKSDYDWREVETKLNTYPQFITKIDGQDIHFVHVKSKVPNATPIILTHGWPTSFVEYIPLIDKLVDPEAYGGTPAEAFDVVVPCMPGFAFSGPTTEKGWNRYRTAKAWAELMKRLGYKRYIAAGNDGGSLVSPEVGRIDSDHVAGVHVTQIFSFPSGDPEEFKKLPPEDLKKLEVLEWFNNSMSGFSKLQATKPHNLAHALADSPVGQLGWSLTLFGSAVSKEFIITNVMLYWLTNTAASSARFYYEDAHAADTPTEPTTVPIGLANFAFDFQSIRTFAERDHKKIVSWNTFNEGGHFATDMTPDLYVKDLRQFARKVMD